MNHNHNDISKAKFHIITENGIDYVANNQGYVHCVHPTRYENGKPVKRTTIDLPWGARAIICGMCGEKMQHHGSPGVL